MDADYKRAREEKYRSDSKHRLSKILRKKIETTMIGALSSIEEHFGFLWAEDSPYSEEEKALMLDMYNKVRSEILDKGNTQSRNVDAELSQYEVKWQKYTMVIPVKPREN
jgi:transcription termination factor Rho